MKYLIKRQQKSESMFAVPVLYMRQTHSCLSGYRILCLVAALLAVVIQSNAAGIAKDGSKNKVQAKHLELQSPDKMYRLSIETRDAISWKLFYKNRKVASSPAISLKLPSRVLGSHEQVLNTAYREVDTIAYPVYGDFDHLAERYNELTIHFESDFDVIFRAYDQGIAYRFKTKSADSLTIIGEQADFRLPGEVTADIAMTNNLTAWELPYQQYSSVRAIPDSLHAITPALFTVTQPECRIVIAEADVRAYPGMYLQRKGELLSGYWASYPKTTAMGSWGNFVSVVKDRQNYIAKTAGHHKFPWRVIIATDDDRSLLTNKLIYLLSEPNRLPDTHWIRPGKATWEWWHDAILPGVNMPSGMDNRNTALYNYYVDFAAKHDLEYLMIDAGWSNVYDIQKPNPKIDIRQVIRRARSKHVGVFLWCVASSLLKDLPGNMDYLAGLGIAGLKVDFFDRDDQVASAWMESIAQQAAKRHLLVDFHGCTKPSGLERTYPNIINYEAVRGAECDKWDTTANPGHHLTVPFIRMLAGPIDYTSGAMRNKTRASFRPIGEGLPSAMGTRCHELAMYVVFDQPLAMLCDAPSVYEKYPDVLSYLSRVPTTFNDTKVLSASLGNYAVIAKRSDEQWFIGAMTNWSQRDISIDCAFLPKGKKYAATIFKDGPDADHQATDYVVEKLELTHASKLNMHLAPGGGAALWLKPID
ncbi:glycoside hydrolase family 97 protein [Arachidicoccus terrestris]|uniref:glycoside hydrolase family 97 protein n=1 Tax=Arachidicoccus terrestris TaxID=2875539 RepID=UPI001CC3B36D|nr:glycoside hydrolase family 97 protein [Arachidicoccus terrestris]UAY56868.1 glycoside hydrolase family 97 protein [Arachidicoccus terrestris]